MSQKSGIYRFTSGLMAVLLLLQLLVPALSWPGATAVHATTATNQPEISNQSSVNGVTAVTQPKTLVQPLSVARTQSSFTDLGSTLIITYTVKNNLSPQLRPDLPTNATPQEIVDAMTNFDLSADPNTLRNVILSIAPTASSSILSTSQSADVSGDQYIFLLDNLPPQSSATIIVTAATPASVSATTALITAAGWASLNGQPIQAEAAPALVLPSSFNQWLISTIDANTTDAEMLQALAPTGGDPDAIFTFVRNFGFEAYRGSLRGTRGTLWSEAGNSLDQSSLLIAMLRASGIPARYRHGSLNTTDAQTLIAGMFPAPTAILGQVAPEIPVSDPVNDADLIAETQDHWWVEAYVDGGWTDLDPSFANAVRGQLFASQIASDGTDRIAELTDDFRPTARIRLNVETYNQLNIGGLPAVDTYLDHTFRIVEIATASVVFANQVETENQGGAVYANTIHTYTPFLHINDLDQIIFGDSYQELLTSFPLATTFITGAWLLFDVEDVDGRITSYERTLRDRLGYEIRTFGGTPDIVLEDTNQGILSEFDIYSISFFPGVVPTAVYEARRAALTGVTGELAADTNRMQELAALEPLSAAQQAEASQIRARYQLNLSLFLNSLSMNFAEAADRASLIAQETFNVKAYHDDPRLVIISHEVISNTAQFSVDLRTTLERTLAYPGQGKPAAFGFNMFKGINESWLEGEILSAMSDDTVLTTAQVMKSASEQNIEFVFIGETNLNVLNTIAVNDEARARITTAVTHGKLINIPTSAPLIDGQPAIGWWEIDLETGETIGVMENGLHNALIEFIGNILFGVTVGRLTDFMIGATAATFDHTGKTLFKALGLGEYGTPAKDAMSTMNQGLGCLLGDAYGCSGQAKGYIDYGYMAMDMGLNSLAKNDPPLPEMLLGSPVLTTTQTVDTAVLNLTANAPGGSITANLQTGFTQLTDANGSLSFYAAAIDPLASGQSGSATAVNHTHTTNLNLTNTDLQIAAPSGTLTSGGQPVTPGSGLAVVSFAGTVDVTAVTPTRDQISLNGSGDLFTLAATPASSSIAPVDTAVFNADLTTTFADEFTVTVSAPAEWQVEIDNTGQVTATPPSGAVPDDYVLILTAQSAASPNQILTAEHIVTITAHDGLLLNVVPDPLITVPMGEKLNTLDTINTGQAQVPNAAYIIELTNPANVAHDYTITTSGLPAGWTLLGGDSRTTAPLSLPAGKMGQLGLYVTPDSIPAAGTTHTINVTAVDENGRSASDSITFVMPAVPFSYITVDPAAQAVTASDTAVYNVTIHNVGNATGDFGLTAEAYNFDGSVSFSPLPAPVSIPAAGSATFPISVTTTNAPSRSRIPLFFGSPVANTIYTPTGTAELWVSSAEAEPFINAANQCTLPQTLNASFLSLATAVDELSFWCEQGDCPLPLRDNVAASGQSLVNYARITAEPTTLPTLADVDTALTNLAAQTSDNAILTAVSDLGTAVYTLAGESCEVEQHRPAARFTPYVDAILLGETAVFSLDVTNKGSIATTYAITVTGLPGGEQSFNETINPDGTINLPITTTPAALGVFDLTAAVVPVAPDVTMAIEATAVARLNVVDKFVQVTQVRANPDFVETGTSSTDLSVEIANVSGVAQAGNARTAVLAPNGSTAWTQDISLTALAGNPRFYDLATVDTSGWAIGTYTVTVDFLDNSDTLIPDGSGYGYFSVGQALNASQIVLPELVAPGNVTVTTIITTEMAAVNTPAAPVGFANAVPGEVIPFVAPTGNSDVLPTQMFGPQAGLESELTTLASTTLAAPSALANVPGYTRYEEYNPAILYNGAILTDTVGAWTLSSQTIASGGQTAYSGVLSDTISLSFTGTAVLLGFFTTDWGGLAQVDIDGVVQEIVDTYSNENNLFTRRYTGLSAGAHTITITILAQRNPFALRDYIYLDFIDVWEGTPLADGMFEAETDPRIYSSGNWNIISNTGASGGQYLERGSSLWFPFTGDSVGIILPNDHFSNDMRLFVDDQLIEFFDIYSPTFITETLAFDGFGSGIHLLRLENYRGWSLADAFVTPGAAPFWQPTDKSGFFRYEEDDPDLRYNGAPFSQTATSWSRSAAVRASDNQYILTSTAGDTVSLTFGGEWVSLGFMGESRSGQIEILIDSVSQGIYDLFRHDEDPVTIQFTDLGTGVHTVTAVNLGTTHPNSTGTRMIVDYIDAWDGTPLPQGKIEAEDDTRTYYSGDLGIVNETNASGGAYVRDGLLRQGNMWFPFTGDSITLQTWSGALDSMRVKIDGVEQPPLDLLNTVAQTRTVNFAGLGTGIHVLELNRYRNDFNADAFIVPAATATFDYPPAPQTGLVRYEENDPALRYNGAVYTQTVNTWGQDFSYNISSDYVASTSTTGNNVALDFYGSWFGVGFESTSGTGLAEIYVDGTLLDTVDTSGNTGPMSVYYDVITGTHAISVTAVNPIRVDFIDTWDTIPMPDGWYDADLNDRFGEFHFSTYWAAYSNDYTREEDMIGRGLINTRRTAWFAFTGNDLTFQGYNDNGGQYEIYIDGLSQGVYTTTAVYSDQPINWHFPDLGSGPHVFSLRALDGSSFTFVDAFHVNPEKFVDAAPSIEWFDFTAGAGGGFLSTMAAGDINNDGVVEIIAPSNDGNLYVYRGDGQDAGSGSPLIWSAATGVSNEPSIADIDLDGYGEVLLLAENGLFAFEHDGTTKWVDNAIFSSISSGSYGWGGVAVGNLDLDAAPELVVAPSQQQAAVVSADGTAVTRFGPTFGDFPTVPILADVNGDGLLDIIIADDDTIYAYDYFNSLNLIWSYTYDTSDITPNVGSQTWGAPAVANLDADDDPEIIIFFEEKVVALNHDGSELWVYKVDKSNGYRPSHVTVADVDGDGEVEIIVAQGLSAGLIILNHEILVLNADGTLLWNEIVSETTSSSSGVATHDFNGDGIWEVLWNGYGDGFLIFNGPDGDRIFNEPRINSGTIVDYPSVADVDGDNFAEVLLGDDEGLWVVGHDDVWADSRPLWSSSSYRITNINDDLSIPLNEQPSWLLHNTYRTQTPNRSPAPAYQVAITYTEGINNVAVLTNTASIPLTAAPPTYTWSYHQEWYQPVVTTTFDSLLTGMQPGEVRQVSQGTQIGYQLPSGINYLTLPPLYVAAPRIVTMNPAETTAAAGSTAVYNITLLNPNASSGDTYTLSLAGTPADWASYPASVNLAAGEEQTVQLSIIIPADAAADTLPVIVDVTNGAGGTDQTMASLTIIAGLEMSINPDVQTAVPGEPITYTLTITNNESVQHTYTLAATGLVDVTLPPTVVVGPGSVVTVDIVVSSGNPGPQPFIITATGDNGAADSVDAILDIPDAFAVALALAPNLAVTGPGSTAVLTATVTNLSRLAENFDLSVVVPAGWSYKLMQQSGTAVNQVNLPPNLFNSTDLLLLVTPDVTAAVGDYEVAVTAVSQNNTAVTQTITGTVQVSNRGVQVEILSGPTTLDPRSSGTWNVRVTNTGSVADTFNLQAAGLLALAGQFSSNAVTLSPGQSQTVQLIGDNLNLLLPKTYAVVVAAVSQTNAQIQAQDSRDVTLVAYETVTAVWQPATQTITDTLTADFTLIVTNTSNTPVTYEIAVNTPGATIRTAVQQVTIPANSAAAVPVTVDVPHVGTYQVSVEVNSLSSSAASSDTAVLTVNTTGDPYPIKVMLPVIMK